MNSEPNSPRSDLERSYFYDDGGRLSEARDVAGNDDFTVATYVYSFALECAPSFSFAHDKEKRLFVLTWPDGRIERFRDNPARQLMVEPDPMTGDLRPVTKLGEPVYIYLCREEREIT
jgi:hypothetical protein